MSNGRETRPLLDPHSASITPAAASASRAVPVPRAIQVEPSECGGLEEPEPAWKRFLKALAVAWLVWFLLCMLVASASDWPFSIFAPKSPTPAPVPSPAPDPYPHPHPAPQPEPYPEPRPVPQPEPSPQPSPQPRPKPPPKPAPAPPPKPGPVKRPVVEASYPTSVDGQVVRCFPHQRGLHAPETNLRWTDTELSGLGDLTARAVIDLPLYTDDAIFAITRGSAVDGIVVVEEASGSMASVRVEVQWDTSMTTKSPYLFEVCELVKDNDGGRGFGLYLPNWASTAPQGFTWPQVVLTLSLPRGPIKSLKTYTYNYAHDLRMSERTTFSTAEFVGQFRNISGKLNAQSLALTTINSCISGSYTATRKLSLHTSNAAVDAQLVLGSWSVPNPTLNIGTTNAPITGSLSLLGAPSFDAILRTTNATIDLAVSTLPINAKLTLDAETDNAPARLTLPATFEGDITQATPGGDLPWFSAEFTEDPAKLGRRHVINRIASGTGFRHEQVSWGSMEGSGKVMLRTSKKTSEVHISANWRKPPV